MKKITFLTPYDAEYGFSLAGVAQYPVKDSEVEETLKKLMADGETGLVIVDERLTKAVSAENLRAMEKRWQGVFLILPAPEKAGVEIEDYALKLIKRAIGYHVKVKL